MLSAIGYMDNKICVYILITVMYIYGKADSGVHTSGGWEYLATNFAATVMTIKKAILVLRTKVEEFLSTQNLLLERVHIQRIYAFTKLSR